MKDNFHQIMQSAPINSEPKIPAWKKDKWGGNKGGGSHWGSPYWAQPYYPPMYDRPLVVEPAAIDADAKEEMATQAAIANPVAAKSGGSNFGIYIFGSALVLVAGYALLSGKLHAAPVK